MEAANKKAAQAEAALEAERHRFALLEVEVRRQFEAHCHSFEQHMRRKVAHTLEEYKVHNNKALLGGNGAGLLMLRGPSSETPTSSMPSTPSTSATASSSMAGIGAGAGAGAGVRATAATPPSNLTDYVLGTSTPGVFPASPAPLTGECVG